MTAALVSCHHSAEPSATRIAISGMHSADMNVDASHILRFSLLFNICAYSGWTEYVLACKIKKNLPLLLTYSYLSSKTY